MRDMTIERKSALITGASSGIGEAFARKLSREGYRTILVARRKDRLEKLASELPLSEILIADLSKDNDLHIVEQRIAAEPQLEILINNAGFGMPGCFWETDREALDKMHRVHIIAIERLTHAALQGMVAHQSGGIINVSSIAGFLHTTFAISYCSTKAWVNRFTEGLYTELKAVDSPVRVQALCPGFTNSEFFQTAGMDLHAIPRSLLMRAEDVVEISLRALRHNKLFVIPGWHNRLFVYLYRILPPFLKHKIAIVYGRRSHVSVRKP
jgi:short-subunit dehydrogenase